MVLRCMHVLLATASVTEHEPLLNRSVDSGYPDLFFYQHIPKTGGTSWSIDISSLQGGPLHHCGRSHLVGHYL